MMMRDTGTPLYTGGERRGPRPREGVEKRVSRQRGEGKTQGSGRGASLGARNRGADSPSWGGVNQGWGPRGTAPTQGHQGLGQIGAVVETVSRTTKLVSRGWLVQHTTAEADSLRKSLLHAQHAGLLTRATHTRVGKASKASSAQATAATPTVVGKGLRPLKDPPRP